MSGWRDLNPEQLAIASDVVYSLRDELLILPDRSQAVLEHRYWDGMTLRAIGELIGLSRERVRQIEWRSFRRLRDRPVIQEMYPIETPVRWKPYPRGCRRVAPKAPAP